ncbi:MAG: hypothetical protein AB7U20_20680 [Planctomycetaceae bacterium]
MPDTSPADPAAVETITPSADAASEQPTADATDVAPGATVVEQQPAEQPSGQPTVDATAPENDPPAAPPADPADEFVRHPLTRKLVRKPRAKR